jgi:hypothetical protein
MAIFFKFQRKIFISNFKNLKFSFQSSKMNIFKFFISNFCDIFHFFSFPSGGMAKIFKFQISKSIFFQFFPFPSGDIAKFVFKIQK